MKILGVFLVSLIFLLNGCVIKGEEEHADEVIYRRLAPSADAEWGHKAIGLPLPTDNLTRPITIAVIDTGTAQIEDVETGYNPIHDSGDIHDESGHGTSVISILRDVNARAEILPVKAMGRDGKQQPETVAKGIRWAVQQQVDIINLSVGMPFENNEVREAIEQADRRGIIVVAASGNNGLEQLDFPANYSAVISVVARDINNVDAGFSNRSYYKKSLSAPGVQVGSRAYAKEAHVSGTSFATAYVSGAISLLLQHTLNSPQEVVSALKQSAVDGNSFTYGLIQVNQAFDNLQKLPRNVSNSTAH